MDYLSGNTMQKGKNTVGNRRRVAAALKEKRLNCGLIIVGVPEMNG